MKSVFAAMLVFSSLTAAAANEMQVEVNGTEYYVTGEDCSGFLAMGTLGLHLGGVDANKLKRVERLPEPSFHTVSLNPDTLEDFLVNLDVLGKIIVTEAAESKIEFTVYSDQKTTPVSELIKFNQAANQLTLQSIGGKKGFLGRLSSTGSMCALELKNDRVVAVYGTCVMMKVYLGRSDRIKLYRGGRYFGRSPLAQITYADIRSLFSDWRSATNEVLAEYLAQPNITVSDEQMIEIVRAIDSTSGQVRAIGLLEPKLSVVSGTTLIRLLGQISSTSAQEQAVQILKDKISLRGDELASVIRQISSTSVQAQVTALLSGSTVGGQSGSSLVSLLKGISANSAKIAAIRSALPNLNPVTGEDLLQVLKTISSTSTMIEALRVLQSKAELTDNDLVAIVGNISSTSSQLDAARILLPRLSAISGHAAVATLKRVSGDSNKLELLKILRTDLVSLSSGEMIAVLRDISSSSRRLETLTLLLSKVDRGNRPDLERFVNHEFDGSNRRMALEVLSRWS